MPLADYSRSNWSEVIYNFVVFVPFGLLLSATLKRARFLQKLALIFAFSLAAEIIQYVFAIGRTDITDVIANTSGGLFGLALYYVTHKYIHNEKLDRFITIAGSILLALAILFLGLLLSSGVRFQSSPQDRLQRARTHAPTLPAL